MPFVKNELVEQDADYGRTINRSFDIWIKPHVESLGGKFEKEKIVAFLVELFPDGKPPKVLLNQEVSCTVEFNKPLVKREDVGKTLTVNLNDIKSFSWSSKDLDPNSGKVLVVRFNPSWWILTFDFRYNQETVKKKLQRAKEFLKAAKALLALKKCLTHPLIDCIRIVQELVFEIRISIHAMTVDKKASKTSKHLARKMKIEELKASAFFSSDFTDQYLSLYAKWNPSRYGEGDFSKSVSKSELKKMIGTLEREMKRVRV